MQEPYLSIILTSRNDDYAGGMLPRLQICIDSVLEQSERFQLELELIIVDWNPPSEKPSLRAALDWSKIGDNTSVRVIEVPAFIHQQLNFGDKLPFLAHTARNVGIRRAKGKFVLVTATDILFSDEVIAFLAAKKLDSDKNYRISRHDVPAIVIEKNTVSERLNFCKKNINYIYAPPKKGLYGLPKVHFYAAGDFVLLSKENCFKLRGIPEEKEYHSAHFDTVFCYMMEAIGVKEEMLTEPMKIYHMDHESFWESNWILRVERLSILPAFIRFRLVRLLYLILQPKNGLDKKGIPYIEVKKRSGRRVLKKILTDIVHKKMPTAYNDTSWGLGAYTLPLYDIIPAKEPT